MRNLLGLFVLVGGLVTESYSQGYSYYKEIDTVVDGGHFRLQIFKGGLFDGILEDAINSQKQIARPLSYYEEIERLKKEEEDRFNRMIDKKRIVAYTNIIGLTEAESLKFWPIYDDYSVKCNAILITRDNAMQKLNDLRTVLTDKEANYWTNVYVNSFEEESNLMKQYREKFKTVLGKKLPLFYRAEHQFKLWMLRQLGGFEG